MKKTFLASALLSLYAPSIFAQETITTAADETMVITANRFEQTQASTLATVSVVEREQIELLQADSAFDVLRTLPGVEITSQGSKASNSSIFIRGANSNQTLVLLDGVRLNTAAGGTITTLGVIPAFAIERIEVIRGPRAAVYGADAIGGVISIITKPASTESVHELSLNGGSNSSHQEGWRSVGNLSDSTQASLILNNAGSEGQNITTVDSDNEYGYQSQLISGGINHTINPNWNLGFNGLWQQFENQYVGDFITAVNRQNNEFYSLSGSVNYQSNIYQSSLQVAYSNEADTNGLDQSNAEQSFIKSTRTSVLWVNTYTGLDSVTLNAGVDYSYEEAHNTGLYFGAPVLDFTENTRNNTAIFATAVIEVSTVLVEASVRHDENSAYGSNTTWGIGAGWFITDEIQLTGNYGTAFRAPTFFDLFYTNNFGGSGNADLVAETSKSFEVGINGNHDIVSWHLVAYQNDIKNLIVADPFTYVPDNVDDARIQGIELRLDFETGPVWHTLVGDWKDPQNKTTNTPLDRRAKQNYKWMMNYGYDDLTLSLATVYTGERPEANSTIDLDSYITFDIAASYQATKNLDVKFKVDNVLDEEYETSYDAWNQFYWVGPERAFYAGVDYRF